MIIYQFSWEQLSSLLCCCSFIYKLSWSALFFLQSSAFFLKKFFCFMEHRFLLRVDSRHSQNHKRLYLDRRHFYVADTLHIRSQSIYKWYLVKKSLVSPLLWLVYIFIYIGPLMMPSKIIPPPLHWLSSSDWEMGRMRGSNQNCISSSDEKMWVFVLLWVRGWWKIWRRERENINKKKNI